MRIDLSCPGEILRAELPTAEEPWIRILLLNGTDRGINSCEVTAKVLDREGRELGRTVHRARALAGRPYGTFLMTIPMEPSEGAAGIEARLDKAWFEDNDVWRRNEAAEIEYEDNMLPPGNDLNAHVLLLFIHFFCNLDQCICIFLVFLLSLIRQLIKRNNTRMLMTKIWRVIRLKIHHHTPGIMNIFQRNILAFY